MKNSLKLLALGLVLFLGACATVVEEPAEVDPTGFLGKVLNKTMFMDAGLTQTKGAFSEDGKIFTIPNTVPTVFVFTKSSGPNSATYETVITEEAPIMQTITVYTVDGVSGTLDSDAGLEVMWLGSATPNPDPDGAEKRRFLANVIGKTTYTDDAYTLPFGLFSADGLTFTGEVVVLTFSKMTAPGVAEYTDGTITYTLSTVDGLTGFVDIGDEIQTPIWFKAFGDGTGTEQTDFIANVTGKTAYSDSGLINSLGTFSADGLVFTSITLTGPITFNFSRMIALGTAIFTDVNNNIYTFVATDGLTGTVNIGDGNQTPIWFDPFVENTAKTLFIANITEKTVYTDETHTTPLGAFDTAGTTFTITEGGTALPFSKMTTIGVAEYTDGATTYTLSTVDGLTGFVNIGDGTQTPIWLQAFDAEAAKTAFVALVTGKAAYTELELINPYGTFSDTGLVFALIHPEGPITFSFSKMTATGTAEFKSGGTTYTFIATTATTGSVTISGVSTDLWFDPFDAGLAETLFKNNIMGKTAYSDVLFNTPLGAFNADGTTFTIQGGGATLTLSKMTTIGTATFTDNITTHTFTTPDGITGSLIAGTTLTPLIWFNPTP